MAPHKPEALAPLNGLLGRIDPNHSHLIPEQTYSIP